MINATNAGIRVLTEQQKYLMEEASRASETAARHRENAVKADACYAEICESLDQISEVLGAIEAASKAT